METLSKLRDSLIYAGSADFLGVCPWHFHLLLSNSPTYVNISYPVL